VTRINCIKSIIYDEAQLPQRKQRVSLFSLLYTTSPIPHSRQVPWMADGVNTAELRFGWIAINGGDARCGIAFVDLPVYDTENFCPMYSKSHHGADLQRTNISGLVSADQLRWFWISWHDGNVSYGRGNQRYRNVIGHYNDSDHDPFSVDTMLISSYGDTSGSWVIPSIYYITGTWAQIFTASRSNGSIDFSIVANFLCQHND